MTRTVTLIRGDGIGPEISAATLEILKCAGADLEFDEQIAGLAAVEREKDPLPQHTIDSIERTRLALKGPLATPSGAGYRSVNVALRQHFDLYANVRPVRTIAGVPSRYDHVDLIVVRENTEDIYSGIEHYVGPGRMAAESIAVITRHGSERIVRYAMELARREKRKRVTLVHKAN
ncbi:MAG: Isocitrate dehydrogenase, partial [bacterium]|nr:Isocitrate dehydrogenase [bacterium]